MAKELEKKGEVSLVRFLKSELEDIKRADPEMLDTDKFEEKQDLLMLLEESRLKKERYEIENKGETTALSSQWEKLNFVSSQLDNIERKAKVNVLEVEKKKIEKLDWNGQRSVQVINLTEKQIKITNPELNKNIVSQAANFHEANRLEAEAYKLDHPSDKVIVQKLKTAVEIFTAQAKGYERAARIASPIKRK